MHDCECILYYKGVYILHYESVYILPVEDGQAMGVQSPAVSAAVRDVVPLLKER